MKDFLELAADRFSCRFFSDRVPDASLIDKIVQAGIVAPTATNAQPWHAWVIESPEAVARMSEVTKYSFGAQRFVLVGGKADQAWQRVSDERTFADVDASIVATHMMLAAHDLGLGTTWVASFDVDAMKELVPEARDYDLVALFPIGYPSQDCQPAPRHTLRKSVEELVSRV